MHHNRKHQILTLEPCSLAHKPQVHPHKLQLVTPDSRQVSHIPLPSALICLILCTPYCHTLVAKIAWLFNAWDFNH